MNPLSASEGSMDLDADSHLAPRGGFKCDTDTAVGSLKLDWGDL